MSLQPQEPLAIKRATIQDVARAAGVSASTVSHVLNATASISNETRERVLAAVDALQYYPNITARSLRKKHTNVIGLLMQDMTSLFYSIAYERLLVRAQEKGYLLTMMCGHWDSELNAKNIATLIEHQAEGVIAMGTAVLESDLKRASDRGLQVVLCDQYSPEFANVEYNNYTTMRRLVHCFAADDVTRISYVCTSIRRQDSTEQRHRGYVQGMLDEGLDPDKLLIALDLKESKYFRWNKQFDRFTDFLEATPRDKWPQVVLCEHDAIAQAEAEHKQLAETLNAELCRAYERSCHECGGIGVAELVDGSCSACRSAFDSTRISRIKQDAPVSRCPSCRRLLIVTA